VLGEQVEGLEASRQDSDLKEPAQGFKMVMLLQRSEGVADQY